MPYTTKEVRALSLRDVALQLNCSIDKVRRLVKSGQLAAFRVGVEFRILPADLDAFIERNLV